METLTATVTKTNGNGFQVAERDGWLNISKYATPKPAMPNTGERVTITLDKSGFIRKVEPAAAESTTPTPTATSATPSAGPDRERCITRLATLNTATAILGSGSRAVDIGDVLVLAATLEAWVYR